ncbi:MULTISPECIES: plasmid pRiA4b ORF-3 family protein [unclassified Frankia]|uniref:plasmid pRiA4b ORF-3 family protein n=1 Tax=unclassified Frankia TaxID=2632575 RepID=UPI002AD1D096|nr:MULTISPECIES: plasmid pRiA4b ORF-3 family protein [unclassified Frankia]
MSSANRARKKSGRTLAKSRNRSAPSPYAPVLDDAAELHREESILIVEAWASQLLGQIWVAGWADDAADGAHDPNDFLQNEVEALIRHMAGQRTPAGLAVLRALALVGEDWTRELATEAGRKLAGRGVPEPAWVAHTDVAELTDALSMTDMFGDVEVITLGFRRADTEHAFVVFVDHASLAGIFKIMIGELADDGITGLVEMFGTQGSLAEPIPLPAAQARARLDEALDRMLDHGPPEVEYERDAPAAEKTGSDDDGDADSDDEGDPAGGWALLRARLDLLPDDQLADADDGDGDGAGGGLDIELIDDEADREEAERVAAAFLASDHAEALPDREAARIWARMAADWALDLGRPAQRYGPLSLGYFLITEVSQHIALGADDLALLPAVIRAWAHFTTDARELGSAAHEQWDEQLPDILDEFVASYREPDAADHRATCADVIDFRLYETETSSEAVFDRLYASAPAFVRRQLDDAELAVHPPTIPAAAVESAGTVHQIKVLLRGSKPPIWRRLEISSTSTLADLHNVIQAAFDWDDDHLWMFTTAYGKFGCSPDLGDRDPDEATIAQIAGEGVTFRYLFDFGDDLDHDVIVEKVVPVTAGAAYPQCIGGRQPDPVQYYFDEDGEGRADALFDKDVINARLARLRS